ncbi:hypothetical protein [Sphingobium bisphenolivorans]|uniref:hypothetical protein n=1 Tax=Sphingobium bisphenolivorans TaxID=1335760 RepID=UPI001269DCB4|nr:hypothetical protein [Sphingobium bisphenolivorans]
MEMVAIALGIATLTCVWLIGSWHFWRLQSASRAVSKVGPLDRVIAIFWLPVGLCFLLLALPFLFRTLLASRHRREKLRLDRERVAAAARCSAHPHVVRLGGSEQVDGLSPCCEAHGTKRADKVSRA